jgi:hypothetical protein
MLGPIQNNIYKILEESNYIGDILTSINKFLLKKGINNFFKKSDCYVPTTNNNRIIAVKEYIQIFSIIKEYI